VVGGDDIPIARRLGPALTTVRQPLLEKGRIAAALLLGRATCRSLIAVPPRLVVRGTTCAA
jgi:DNA-binding LacI/PurR family transcriptional regulator